MVQYIPGEPTLGGNIGAGISRGLATGMQDFVSRRAEERKEAKRKQELLAKRHQKLGDTATNFVSKYIKEFDPGMLADDKTALQQRYLDLLSQAELSGQDVDPNHLLQMAVNQGKEQEAQSATQAKPDWKNPATNAPSFEESGLGRLLSSLGERRDLQIEGRNQRDLKRGKSIGEFGIENPMSLLKEIPVGVAKLGEGLVHMGGEVGDLMGMQKVIGMLTGNKQLDIPEIMKRKGAPTSEALSQVMRKGLSEEDSQVAERLSSVYENLAPWFPAKRLRSFLLEGTKGTGKALETLLQKIGVKAEQFGSQAAREAAINAEGILSGSAAKTEAAVEGTVSQAAQEMLPTEAKPLAGRVSEKAPKPETLARVERQEARPFKKETEIKLREKQLKQYPEYEEDILKDRAKMLENREKLVPKTERGLASQQSRMAGAQADLPGVQKVYQSTAARVRALENQLASQPGNKQIQEVLAVAKNELKDAEFLHKQTLENAKLGSSRVGKDAMRDAARKKTMEISEKIANGEEVQLAKMDYNPELVKKGKEISKRKPLEAKKVEDFHTQVHDTYGDVYRERLGQLDKQIKELAKNKSLSSLHQRQVLDKERQALKKLIDHTDAESAIHRHNLALRERFERQKAASRFKQAGKSTPVKETKKTQEAVKGKFDMKKSTQEGAKSPEAAAKAAEDVIDEAARQNPKQAESIGKQKEEFSKTAKETQQEASKEGKTFAETIKEATTQEGVKEAVSKTNGWFKNWLGGRAKELPRIGKSFLYGMAIDSFKNALDVYGDIEIPSKYLYGGLFIAGAIPKGRSRLGGGVLGVGLSSYIWDEVRISKLRTAIREKDRNEYQRLQKKFGPKMAKEAKDREEKSRRRR